MPPGAIPDELPVNPPSSGQDSARIRIAHVVFGLGIGGLEKGVLTLVRGLDPERFEHGIFCMKTLGPNAEHARAAGARVELVGNVQGSNRLIILKLRRWFRRFRPHVVHTRNFGALDGVVAAWLARVPAIIHGEHGWDSPDPMGTSSRRRRVRRWLSPMIDRYVAVSDQINGWLSDHGPRLARKVTTIRNGVDLDRFVSLCERPADRPVVTIGTVGRLAPIKDHACLVSGFDAVADGFPAARLLIAGGGELENDLDMRVAEARHGSRMTLAGPVEDVDRIYRELDVFVLPSRNEGLSNTILEAMAAGLPTVATNVGGNPELVVDGETGVLIPPRRPDLLAEAVRGYLADPERARAHGRAARRRAEKHFSLERMCGGYARLYEESLPTGKDDPSIGP